MDPLLKISHRPATCVPPGETICTTVKAMVKDRVGAAAVLNPDGSLAGIFTERDLMTRVVAQHRDPGNHRRRGRDDHRTGHHHPGHVARAGA